MKYLLTYPVLRLCIEKNRQEKQELKLFLEKSIQQNQKLFASAYSLMELAKEIEVPSEKKQVLNYFHTILEKIFPLNPEDLMFIPSYKEKYGINDREALELIVSHANGIDKIIDTGPRLEKQGLIRVEKVYSSDT
ncbi:MAG: hypothetical protein H7A25_12595 [Leptospiraceae bacterium]|nr:hypothetical protein [Leptospiraceae bacterium]MCP5500738.1 hypothetical protein [Leptospiraceae bacterium]